MQGTECKFEYSGVQTKVVRVFGFSKLEDCGPLAREIGQLRKVLGVSEDTSPDGPRCSLASDESELRWHGLSQTSCGLKTRS
ncbi:hypothetical protein HPB50_019150 [Hyalomma asiaticum]|uniref:Uncharacterized protein n=1 Tax=Hyalomma asiaticum TaxID=266040 RepID=A0ACB7RVS7_HYAAI|nr:hypothetical protein HPB50_019150 [Hyalomma asiaticum]